MLQIMYPLCNLGTAYNGECIDLDGLLDGDIYVHDKAFYYSNPIDNDHIRDCSDFCKNVQMRIGYALKF